jgi:hypothetical protein
VVARLLLLVLLALGAPGAAVAVAAQGVAELDLDVAYEPNESFGRPKEFPVGAPGRFSVGAFNNGPDDATGIVIVVTSPATARFVSAVSACTVAPQRLTCTAAGPTRGAGRGAGFLFAVVSDVTGPMTLNASVTSDQTDPDPSDNLASVTVEILAAGGGGASAVRAGKLTRTPVSPRAGRRLTAALRITGSPLPGSGSVGCSASVRGKALKPLARSYKGGVVSCAWLVPRSAKGARLSGTVSFTTGGSKLSRKFGVTVAG